MSDRKPKLPADVEERLIEAFVRGGQLSVISKVFSITDITLCRWLRHARESGRFPEGFRPFLANDRHDPWHDETILAMHEKGFSPGVISDHLMISAQFIERRLDRMLRADEPEDVKPKRPPGHLMTEENIAALYQGRRYDRRVA